MERSLKDATPAENSTVDDPFRLPGGGEKKKKRKKKTVRRNLKKIYSLNVLIFFLFVFSFFLKHKLLNRSVH